VSSSFVRSTNEVGPLALTAPSPLTSYVSAIRQRSYPTLHPMPHDEEAVSPRAALHYGHKSRRAQSERAQARNVTKVSKKALEQYCLRAGDPSMVQPTRGRRVMNMVGAATSSRWIASNTARDRHGLIKSGLFAKPVGLQHDAQTQFTDRGG